MERESRQRKAAPTPTTRRIKLSEADFWKFRAALNDVRSIELEATEAALKFRQRVADADQSARAFFAQLGRAHGFDPKKTYGWDDSTCELIEVPQP